MHPMSSPSVERARPILRRLRRLAPALALGALALPASAGAATVGATTVGGQVDGNSPGRSQDYRFTAPAAGPVSRLGVFLDRSNTATKVELGLYSGSTATATKRLAGCVVTSPAPNAWNRCAIPTTTVAAGATYWLAVLQPAGATGTLRYRNDSSTGASYASSSATLTSLPATWPNGANWSPNLASVVADQAAAPAPAAPTARFTMTPSNPSGTPAKVDFDASSSSCAAAPCTYRWLHAGTAFGTGVKSTFTYQGTGTKTVTLQVTDAKGRTASVDKSFAVTAGPAPTPSPTPAPSGTCNVTVSTRAALQSAVQSTANAGRTVCATAADYGTASLRFSVRQPSKLTLRPAAGQKVTMPPLAFDGVDNVRVQGFNMPRGGFETGSGATNNHIEVVGNEIHDCACQALRLFAKDTDLLFQGNDVHGIHHDGGWQTGWGIKTDGPTSGLKVRYNTFDGLGNDAMEIGGANDGEIVGNVIEHVDADPGYPDPHPDSIMLWAGAKRWLIKDNRISDGRGILMSGSTTDVRMENNLIVRIENYCQDGGTTGTSNDGLVRYQWIRNTIYDCGSFWGGGGFGGGYGLLSDGPATAGASNTLSRNLLTNLSVDTTAQFASSDHNLVKSGSRPGATDVAFTPTFADQVDYKPTNLPAGYADVGYRAAPAGHLAAP
jgi:hypothetical protein